MMQADAILTAETQRGREVLRYGPSEPALEALDAIHDRLESPADRMLRQVAPRSSYLVLPLFALGNAGVEINTDVFSGHAPLIVGTAVALVIGKPLGFIAATAAAVWFDIATKPNAYSWRQLAGAGALAGIGFTMSLFIASEAFSSKQISPQSKLLFSRARFYRPPLVPQYYGTHARIPVRARRFTRLCLLLGAQTCCHFRDILSAFLKTGEVESL